MENERNGMDNFTSTFCKYAAAGIKLPIFNVVERRGYLTSGNCQDAHCLKVHFWMPDVGSCCNDGMLAIVVNGTSLSGFKLFV